MQHCFIRSFTGGSENPGQCDGHVDSDFNLHWSYYFNSRSLMFGSFIEDLGKDKFRFYFDKPKYSTLDQYLMGLREANEVPPMFVVDDGNMFSTWSTDLLKPGEEKTVEGTRIDFTIDDVIAALGARNPVREECHWKAAFMIVYPKGMPPSKAQMEKVDSYRKRWEEFYSWATDGRGSMDTTIDGRGTGTDGCRGKAIEQPDAGVDSGVADSGSAGDGSTDTGAFDTGFKDSGFDTGVIPDASKPDTGLITDSGVVLDSGTDVDTGAGGDGSHDDPAQGCSCATLGL
jgi:hypothetical protein